MSHYYKFFKTITVFVLFSAHCLSLAFSQPITVSKKVVSGGSQVISSEENADFISISDGGGQNLAVRGDGSAVAWGWDQYRQSTVIAGLEDLVPVTQLYNNSAGRIFDISSDSPENFSISVSYGTLRSFHVMSTREEEMISLVGLGGSFCIVRCKNTLNTHIGLAFSFYRGDSEFTETRPLVGGGTTDKYVARSLSYGTARVQQNISRFQLGVGIGALINGLTYTYDPPVINPGVDHGAHIFLI